MLVSEQDGTMMRLFAITNTIYIHIYILTYKFILLFITRNIHKYLDNVKKKKRFLNAIQHQLTLDIFRDLLSQTSQEVKMSTTCRYVSS